MSFVRLLNPCLTALFTAGCLGLISMSGRAEQTAQTLPPWSPGTLEIHQISTGRGNAALLIFPDGTSLMVDVGDLNRRGGVTRPNDSRRAGEWIGRYAKRFLSHDPKPSLDYVLLT